MAVNSSNCKINSVGIRFKLFINEIWAIIWSKIREICICKIMVRTLILRIMSYKRIRKLDSYVSCNSREKYLLVIGMMGTKENDGKIIVDGCTRCARQGWLGAKQCHKAKIRSINAVNRLRRSQTIEWTLLKSQC